MEESIGYIVEITHDAEKHFIELLSYLYQNHSIASADRKSQEILEESDLLKNYPYRGRIEEGLSSLGIEHRYLLYTITRRQKVRIIYIVDETLKKVFITDFFPCLME